MYSCNISGYTIFLIIPVKAAAQQNFPLLMLVQCRSLCDEPYPSCGNVYQTGQAAGGFNF